MELNWADLKDSAKVKYSEYRTEAKKVDQMVRLTEYLMASMTEAKKAGQKVRQTEYPKVRLWYIEATKGNIAVSKRKDKRLFLYLAKALAIPAMTIVKPLHYYNNNNNNNNNNNSKSRYNLYSLTARNVTWHRRW